MWQNWLSTIPTCPPGALAASLAHAGRSLALTLEAGLSPGPAWYMLALAESAGGSFARAASYARHQAGRVRHLRELVLALVDGIGAAGATPAGVLIALDRQERGAGELSATQEVSRDYGLPVTAIATLTDILATLRGNPERRADVDRIERYREQYGVKTQ